MTEEWASLKEWINILAHHIDTGDFELSKDDILTILDLARDASHQVERAASPLTLFLVGVAVGRGGSLGKVAAQTTALVLSLDDRTTEAAEVAEDDPDDETDADIQ
ncbi:DUF6457 domain-containing protein [Raineyella sp. W15-4]|uniref:DUF6457 domain-containing protein n=1 Tax=Raineyella sp. W15-4 TaxID=3081651 RepID=UPI002953FD8E|nr:DUF6457 domain-containing protein [Raineyella sp. W15-4]WOQ18297.1 DUF6457 domain-containing protein [Raineyella sp. W15-4]